MIKKKILYVVHCVDTEGPLNETLSATFNRVESLYGLKLNPTFENLTLLQNMEIDIGGKECSVAKMVSPELLKYNKSWKDISIMLDKIMSDKYRKKILDDFNNGWVYSWHCMDHVGFSNNPRFKDIGFGNIFRFYKMKLLESSNTDEINWHFHPVSLTKSSIHSATSYVNSYDTLVQILCHRILNDNWFPVVNRPGFHSERPDSHTFLEQWIPFDYANQYCEEVDVQPDKAHGRFGDWSRSPRTWMGYHPSHDDYQSQGQCNRVIFRCLNVGSRHSYLTKEHVREAFLEAQNDNSAILSFSNHDYRDMKPDIDYVREILQEVKSEFPDVLIKYAGAEEAAISLMGYKDKPVFKLVMNLYNNKINVKVVSGEIFGPQPFLSFRTKKGEYFHDNFDVIKHRYEWSYVFDEQTLDIDCISKIGVGAAGMHGKYSVFTIDL
jgi:hypothetical protein